ncbi:hypothetical protein H4R35_003935 [Dimargaris xerosporica]|nr:hypothetical protein H4R35_003935 [Dimargaris xerosporica]
MIEELFEVLASRDLLTNFQAIVESALQKPKYEQDAGSTDQTSIVDSSLQEQHSSENGETTNQTSAAADPVQLRDFYAFVHQFWLEVIGDDNAKQLRYYLSNMLVFDIIPHIIGQALESGERDKASKKALKLAEEISQLDGIAKFAQDYSVKKPNYFEFIMLYATKRKFNDLGTLLPEAQRRGEVKIEFLINCFRGLRQQSSVADWDRILGFQPPATDGDQGFVDFEKCESIQSLRQKALTLIKPANDAKDTLRMFHLGKELNDGYTAFDYNIGVGQTLLVFLKAPPESASTDADSGFTATPSTSTQNATTDPHDDTKGASPANAKSEPAANNDTAMSSEPTNAPPSKNANGAPAAKEKAGSTAAKGALASTADVEYCLLCKNDDDKDCFTCGCCLCGGKHDEDKTLICEECQNYYHMSCLPAPLTKIPSTDWYCHNCFNDPTAVVKADENPHKLSKKRQKMPSATATREWGRGLSCAGVETKCTIVGPQHVGPIPGVPVGSSWRYRINLSASGVHRPPVSGIAGTSASGAVSVVLAAGYPEDEDYGDEFIYTGSGGRDLATGNRRHGVQSFDQELTRFNMALARTCDAKVNEKLGATAKDWRKSRAVRVVRSYKLAKHHPKYAPVEGVRYDGIYRIVKYWLEKSSYSEFKVWRFLFRRDDPEPAPWTKAGEQRIAELGLKIVGEARDTTKKTKTTPKAKTKTKTKASCIGVIEVPYVLANPKTVLQRKFLPSPALTLIDIDKANKRNWQNALDSNATNMQEFLDVLANEVFICPICQSLVKHPITTPCGHNCCRGCLIRSRKTFGDNCPVCRETLEALGEAPEPNPRLIAALRALIPSYCLDEATAPTALRRASSKDSNRKPKPPTKRVPSVGQVKADAAKSNKQEKKRARVSSANISATNNYDALSDLSTDSDEPMVIVNVSGSDNDIGDGDAAVKPSPAPTASVVPRTATARKRTKRKSNAKVETLVQPKRVKTDSAPTDASDMTLTSNKQDLIAMAIEPVLQVSGDTHSDSNDQGLLTNGSTGLSELHF